MLSYDPQVGHYILGTDENMPYICMALESADEVGLDTETTGLNVRNKVDWMQGLCFSVEGLKGYIPFRHQKDNVSPLWIPKVFDILFPKVIDWHNLKFDYHSIATLGIDPLKFTGPQYCTLLIASLVDEELYSKELDALCKKFLKKEKANSDEIHKLGEIYGWHTLPPSLLAAYGAQDAELPRQLKKVLWPRILEQELHSVYWNTELPFNRLLYTMEQRGVGTNGNLASRMAERGSLRMDTIRKNLHFNPASTKDLGHFLLDELGLPVLGLTPKGKPSFRKEIMEEYDEILQASNNPTARMIAHYRGWQKAVSSLYLPLLEKTGPDGRIRTQFNQHKTVTGRLSANDPNLQQVPRGSDKPWNGNAKACFTSGRDDAALIGWDYSQIELRLAAAYGREQVLLTEFEQDSADPFNVLAPLIYGSLTPELRQETKTFVYANLYGAGLPKIAATIGKSIQETEPLFDNYKKSISGIVDVSQQVSRLVERRGWVSYWDGRRRHIRDRRAAYKAWNSVIQGGAAQLMKQSMLRCQEFENDECHMVLSVHDEITFIIKYDKIPEYEPLIVKAMTDWPDFGVRLAVAGKEWK